MMTRLLAAHLMVGALALCLAGQQASAQEPPAIPQERQAQLLKRFPAIDADKDGQVSRQELRKHLAAQHGQKQAALPKGKEAKAEGVGGLSLFPPSPERFLARHPEADADKDGKLSPVEMRTYAKAHGAELRAELLQRHPELDANQDGVLSPEEFLAARDRANPGARLASMVQKRFPESDANKDGKLAPEELRAFMQTRGDEVRAEVLKEHPQFDHDGDGVLSQEELMAGLRAGTANRKARGGIAALILQRFPEADADKDGKLSADEVKALREKQPQLFERLLNRFPGADADRDGQLSEDELSAMGEQRPPKRAKDNSDKPRVKAKAGKKAAKQGEAPPGGA